MSSRAALKERLAEAVAADRDRVRQDAMTLRELPELGFKEERTSAFVADRLRGHGYDVQTGLANSTGVSASLDFGDGPTVCVMAELDALPMGDHPDADPDSGIAHACGHFLQVAHLLALARALPELELDGSLYGRVVFLAVPAEEYADLTWRQEQTEQGHLKALSGKRQLLLDGWFEDIDIAMMCHAGGQNQAQGFTSRDGSAGFVGQRVTFRGKAAHAGRSPDAGINVLQAVSTAIAALNANRDAFPSAGTSRVHGSIAQLTPAVNVVPDRAQMEWMIRAVDTADLARLEATFVRSMISGGLALGAEVEIESLPGYLPRRNSPELVTTARRNAVQLWGEEAWQDAPVASSSTDAGDVSHFLPVLHPNHGGCRGAPHSRDFDVVDWKMATIDPAVLMGHVIIDLLADGGDRARQITDGYPRHLSLEDYRTAVSTSRTVHFDAVAQAELLGALGLQDGTATPGG